MQLLYTGASKQGAIQSNADLSIGGSPSNSQIPNDELNNLFPVASLLSIQNKRRDTKMIALFNDDLDETINAALTFSVATDSICKYKIALVTPTGTNGSFCFEKIPNSSSLPLYAAFSDIIDSSVISLPTIHSNRYLGVWLMREYDLTSAGLKKKTCADWLAQLIALDTDPTTADLPLDETLSFVLNYTLAQNSNSI